MMGTEDATSPLTWHPVRDPESPGSHFDPLSSSSGGANPGRLDERGGAACLYSR